MFKKNNEIIVLRKRNYVRAWSQFFHVSRNIIYFNNKLYLLCYQACIVQTHDLVFCKLLFCLNDLIPGNTLIIRI